ncbi:hypothetical protein ACFWA9_20660 [Kitasatospora sp. NPDC059973]|uniref:hypothetical protein n=1 Tax=Kitasatospora sp. NPDC059973 TaxID=3347020 RepID=UPI00368D11E5
MTTQGERTPPSGDQEQHGAARPAEAHRQPPGRFGARRVVGWVVVVGVVAAGGWIITRPAPGDWIPGLGPASKDASSTPRVVGSPPPRAATDPEGLNVDTLFPAQRVIEVGAYRGKRSGVRQGESCAETLQDRAEDLLRDSGCQAYLAVSFAGQAQPVLSSVTLLRFADHAAAARAAETLRAKPGALTFILPDASTAPAQPAGSAKPGSEQRVAAVGQYVTVTSSRPVEPHGAPPAPSGPPTPVGAPSTAPAGGEQALDEATRAVSYSAGAPFVWM